MQISHLDHLVLTVADIDISVDFYTQILGFKVVTFGDNRQALTFGKQKINLHQKDKEFEPKAKLPTCGSADLCFITDTPIEAVLIELESKNIPVVEGIVQCTGAVGSILSVYVRDPDGNLLEISNYS